MIYSSPKPLLLPPAALLLKSFLSKDKYSLAFSPTDFIPAKGTVNLAFEFSFCFFIYISRSDSLLLLCLFICLVGKPGEGDRLRFNDPGFSSSWLKSLFSSPTTKSLPQSSEHLFEWWYKCSLFEIDKKTNIMMKSRINDDLSITKTTSATTSSTIIEVFSF